MRMSEKCRNNNNKNSDNPLTFHRTDGGNSNKHNNNNNSDNPLTSRRTDRGKKRFLG